MLIGTVTSIGPQAISQKDPIIILFGEGATEDIRQVSVIQAFENPEKVELKVGNTITFDDEVYTIEAVGALATENLNSIGHISLSFSEVPTEDMLGNGVYLKPYKLPELQLATKITYQG